MNKRRIERLFRIKHLLEDEQDSLERSIIRRANEYIRVVLGDDQPSRVYVNCIDWSRSGEASVHLRWSHYDGTFGYCTDMPTKYLYESFDHLREQY